MFPPDGISILSHESALPDMALFCHQSFGYLFSLLRLVFDKYGGYRVSANQSQDEATNFGHHQKRCLHLKFLSKWW
jgi:hypothetical protein